MPGARPCGAGVGGAARGSAVEPLRELSRKSSRRNPRSHYAAAEGPEQLKPALCVGRTPALGRLG